MKVTPDPRIAAYVEEVSQPGTPYVSTSHLTLHRLYAEHGADVIQTLLNEHWAKQREADASVRRKVMRSEVVEIRCYAPGDGHLSFVASLTEDCSMGRRGDSVSPTPTLEECLAACPPGWWVYPNGPYWRAAPCEAQP